MLGYVGQTLWQLSAGLLGSEGKCYVSGGLGARFYGQSAMSAVGGVPGSVGKARCQRRAGVPGSVSKARCLRRQGCQAL